MCNLIVRTLDHLVLVKLLDAFEAERMAARKGNRLLVIVIVRLETNAAFKN